MSQEIESFFAILRLYNKSVLKFGIILLWRLDMSRVKHCSFILSLEIGIFSFEVYLVFYCTYAGTREKPKKTLKWS